MGEGDRRGWCAVSAGQEVETGCVCCKAHWGQEPVTRFIGSFQAVGQTKIVQESRDSSLHLEKLHRNLLTEPVDRLFTWHPELIPAPSPGLLVLQGCLSGSTGTLVCTWGAPVSGTGLLPGTAPLAGGYSSLSRLLAHEIHLVQRELGLISCPGERVGAVLPSVRCPDPVARDLHSNAVTRAWISHSSQCYWCRLRSGNCCGLS